jgi:hypothetical protein
MINLFYKFHISLVSYRLLSDLSNYKSWNLLEHLHGKTVNNSFILKIEYCLMIIVPTLRKRHESSFKHSKTILCLYIWTRVIVTVQIHSKKKLLKWLKWPLPERQERSRIYALLLLQDLMKKGVCRRAVEMLLSYQL